MAQNEIEILLIEDNPDEAELAIRGLKKQNLANNLVHIDDGAEALDYIFSRGKYTGNSNMPLPKLILLDLKLPKVDGLEILRQLKADELRKIIPVVILTSSKEEKDIIQSYKLGVNSYIVKPINFESFATAIAELGLYWLVINQPPIAELKKELKTIEGNKVLKILIIEDNSDDAYLIKKLLERAGLDFQSKVVSEKPDFTSSIAAEAFDIILTDNSMNQFNARDVLSILKQQNNKTPLIIVSGTVSEEHAMSMIREGAFDYVNKDNIKQLISSIQKAAAKISSSSF